MSNDLISREYIKAFICEYEKFNGKETEIVKAIPIQAIDNAPTVDITEEQAIDKLHETGWMQRHDNEMTERPTGTMSNKAWIGFLSEQFNVSRTSAKDMLHVMMSVKKEDNFKKMFNPRPQAGKEAENEQV